jgi:hypothetical protein
MTTIKIKQINDEIVRPVKYQEETKDNRPIKGEKLFPSAYVGVNVFIEAKRASGKTTVANKIVKNCCTNESTVLVFASTVDRDKGHLAIKHYCKMHKIPYIGYTSMLDEGVNIIETLLNDLRAEEQEKLAKEEEDEESDNENRSNNNMILFDSSSDEEETVQKRRNKYSAPKYLIILDDLSNELKSKVLVKLVKEARHWDIMCVILSQYFLDLDPQSRKQIEYCLLFKGERLDKLELLHKDFDLGLDFNVFKKLYYNATAQKYNFLYIDIRNETYRRNFTHKYDIPEKIMSQ